MRFLMLVRHGENPGPPPKEFLPAMAKPGEDAAKSGTMTASGGLVPTSKSTRVRLSRGQVTAIDGPHSLKAVPQRRGGGENLEELLPGSMKLNRPLQIQR